MPPTSTQPFMTPVTSSTPTLITPSIENRNVASRATASEISPRLVDASSNTSGNRPPTHADAAMRCSPSAARWTVPSQPAVAAAWPEWTRAAANAAARSAATAQRERPARSGESRHKAKASKTARASRISQSCPNVVWRRTVHTMPSEKACVGARSLIWAASSTSQAAPETTAIARPLQATRRRWTRKPAPSPGGARSAGPAIAAPKMTAPASASVAAK